MCFSIVLILRKSISAISSLFLPPAINLKTSSSLPVNSNLFVSDLSALSLYKFFSRFLPLSKSFSAPSSLSLDTAVFNSPSACANRLSLIRTSEREILFIDVSKGNFILSYKSTASSKFCFAVSLLFCAEFKFPSALNKAAFSGSVFISSAIFFNSLTSF